MTKEIFNSLLTQLIKIKSKKNAPIRVAINGIEGTGKTTFATNFCKYLNEEKTFNSIHVSIDGFHYNRAHRYKQGKDSAIGYYQDSYNEKAFVEKVLILSQKVPFQYIPATHDLDTDEYLILDPIAIPKNSVIITDGAYLFKENYRNHWDLKIYLKTDFETARKRGVLRDMDKLGGQDLTENKYLNRYHAASEIYIKENNPESLADIIIDYTDFDKPKIILQKL
jgi:uridine kinase